MTQGLLAHYAGRRVLVTGVTGFVGQALLHSLLTRVGCGVVWVVLRARKGQNAQERLEALLAGPLFQGLAPSARERVRLVDWDLERPFPLSEALRDGLLEGLDAIYHCAASVAFAASREENEAANVASTLNVFALAQACARPLHFVHVSTAYAFGRGSGGREPLPEDLLPQVQGRTHANSYTLTKATAEERLVEACARTAGQVRLAIVRPSIVFGAIAFPHAGWNPSFTASAGIVALVARGALRWLPGRENARVDHVPVDRLVNILLLADEALARSGGADDRHGRPPLVLHACAGPQNTLRWGDFARFTLDAMHASPLDEAPRPAFGFTPSRLVTRVRTAVLLRWPGHVLRSLPPRFRSARRLGHALMRAAQCHDQVGELFAPFTSEDWVFASSRARELHAALPEQERGAFPVGCDGVEWPAYVGSCYQTIASSLRARG